MSVWHYYYSFQNLVKSISVVWKVFEPDAAFKRVTCDDPTNSEIRF